jgi:hypothetical protein
MTKLSCMLFTKMNVVLLVLLSSSLQAESLNVDESPKVKLSAYTQYIEDPASSIQIEELLAIDSSHNWSPITTETPNFGFVSSTY